MSVNYIYSLLAQLCKSADKRRKFISRSTCYVHYLKRKKFTLRRSVELISFALPNSKKIQLISWLLSSNSESKPNPLLKFVYTWQLVCDWITRDMSKLNFFRLFSSCVEPTKLSQSTVYAHLFLCNLMNFRVAAFIDHSNEFTRIYTRNPS